MWDAINPHTGIKRIDQCIPTAIRAAVNQQEMKISLKCGSTFQLVGSDNFNSLVGSPPVGLVFSEYAISNPAAWAYLMPILEENGGWACFNSTPRGKNHFFKQCAMAETQPGWFYDVRTADDTGIFTPEQLERIRQELYLQHGPEFGEAMFQQEYYVSFEAAVIGAIWADCVAKLQVLGRIGDYPHDPQYPVHTAWDIGKKDSTAIWFYQIKSQEIYVIDFHQSNHKDVPFYVEEVLCFNVTNKGYRYGAHWLPHDANHDRMGMGGKTIAMQFRDAAKKHGLGKFKDVPMVSKQDGIQAARATFPRCYFNESATEDGLECLRFYHHEYDDEKKVFKDTPEHDWASDASDAFRYLSLVWRASRDEPEQPLIDQQLINKSIQSISMKSITQQHLNRAKAKRESQW